ncbi:MAG: hypothetical protein LH630_00055 [Actinomycetia bacterium]|nr:hypothetical protein [Actinomycetes bacterium]
MTFQEGRSSSGDGSTESLQIAGREAYIDLLAVFDVAHKGARDIDGKEYRSERILVTLDCPVNFEESENRVKSLDHKAGPSQ